MPRAAITGAFSYTGRYLAKRLLDQGHEVVNLSSRAAPLAPDPLTSSDVAKVLVRPLSFKDEARLGVALEGCDVLFCTYWIRFALDGDSHLAASDRCASLFSLARQAGVQKVVFTSHTQATEDSPYPYIAGKARAAAALRAAGLPSYAIARPCGVFGDTAGESILMNNAAWVLRRSPLFLLAGDGAQRFQPIHVRDFADMLAELGGFEAGVAGLSAPHTAAASSSAASSAPSSAAVPDSAIECDACGPDAPTALELFRGIAHAVGSPALVAAPGFLSPGMVTAMTKPIDWLTGDIMLDSDDLDLLGSGLTIADEPKDPTIAKRRSLMKWLDDVGPTLGDNYVSSIRRYYNR